MSSSFEKINYNLRPNKCIERKMMCEALSRLSFIEHLENYRYIGFGSPYFADFILFHKNLGITDLISIEKEKLKSDRFDFNIPYAGITMKYGLSSTVLPNLELHLKKNIVWLDYDDKITDFMFSDIDSFFTNATPGSFFILSVNVEQDMMSTNTEESVDLSLKDYRINQLIDRVGRERIPIEAFELNMNTKNLSATTYEMMRRQINTSLNNRNGSTVTVFYDQIFNFIYKDNATILTIGGILYNEEQRPQVAKMKFNHLLYIKEGAESYKIDCPNLTLREVKALDKILPDTLEKKGPFFKNEVLNQIPLAHNDIKNYARIYRYYPNFTEVNL